MSLCQTASDKDSETLSAEWSRCRSGLDAVPVRYCLRPASVLSAAARENWMVVAGGRERSLSYANFEAVAV